VHEKETNPRPAKTKYSILRQLVQWIPPGLIQKTTEDRGLKARTFSAVGHVVALLFAQLARCGSLNTACDIAAGLDGEWRRVRGAEPPKRNTFSHANRTRDPAAAEALYWGVFAALARSVPSFTCGGRHKGFTARFRGRKLCAIDSSTIRLAPSCIDWARHRRRKAAAKLHMNLNVGSRLPEVAVAEEASHHDSARTGVLCAGLKAGDILVADRAYTDFPLRNSSRPASCATSWATTPTPSGGRSGPACWRTCSCATRRTSHSGGRRASPGSPASSGTRSGCAGTCSNRWHSMGQQGRIRGMGNRGKGRFYSPIRRCSQNSMGQQPPETRRF
jgi:hypothetical protein